MNHPDDAASVLAWIADRLVWAEGYGLPRWDEGNIHSEQLILGEFFSRVRGAPFGAVGAGFAVRWPGRGDTLVVRRGRDDVARLVNPPAATIPARDREVFHAEIVAALRGPVERFFALPDADRVRRRLAHAGYRTDLTRRQWTTLVAPRHLALADRIDFAALDAVLAGHDAHLIAATLAELPRAAADPAFRAAKERWPGVIGPLGRAMRLAPAHVLLRSYLRRSDASSARSDRAAGPGAGPSAGGGAENVAAGRSGEVSVVRRSGPGGLDLAVVVRSAEPAPIPLAAYDLAHAHPARASVLRGL